MAAMEMEMEMALVSTAGVLPSRALYKPGALGVTAPLLLYICHSNDRREKKKSFFFFPVRRRTLEDENEQELNPKSEGIKEERCKRNRSKQPWP